MDTLGSLVPRRCGNCANINKSSTFCRPCIMDLMTDRPRFEPSYAALASTHREELEASARDDAEKGVVEAYQGWAEPPDIAARIDTDRYPDDNPKTRFGLAKPPIALIPGPALVVTAEAFGDGARKYGPANWREKPVTTSTYTSAALRHLLAWIDGEENAPDSGVHHLGHAIGCLAILIDAQAQGSLNDDRPTPGKTSQLLAEKTKPLQAANN